MHRRANNNQQRRLQPKIDPQIHVANGDFGGQAKASKENVEGSSNDGQGKMPPSLDDDSSQVEQ